MDRPDYSAPGAGRDEHKRVPMWVAAFVALLFNIPMVVVLLL